MLECSQANCGRTDGQRRTVSDHNSSLSTPCSGELKNVNVNKVYDKQNNQLVIFDMKNIALECVIRH